MKRGIRVRPKIFFIALSHIYLCICEVTTEGDKKGPKFVEPIPNVTVTVGRDASLPCIISNLGSYKVVWIHIDRQMVVTMHKHVITRIPRYSILVNENTWILRVTRVQQEDRGYYMCQVNTNPIISQVGYLQVTVPPVFLNDDSTSTATVLVRENQNLTLTCRAQGFPTPKIAWKREDGMDIVLNRKHKGPVFSGELLQFERTSRTDMGAYLCIAANGVPPALIKRIYINVEFSPMVLVPNQLIAGTVGCSIVIECQSEANPVAATNWIYKNQLLKQSPKYNIYMTESSYWTHTKLEIHDVDSNDFGVYTCLSKNSLGETEGTVRLYEYIVPTTTATTPRTTTKLPELLPKVMSNRSIHHKVDGGLPKDEFFEIPKKINISSPSINSGYDINDAFIYPSIIFSSGVKISNSKLFALVLGLICLLRRQIQCHNRKEATVPDIFFSSSFLFFYFTCTYLWI